MSKIYKQNGHEFCIKIIKNDVFMFICDKCSTVLEPPNYGLYNLKSCEEIIMDKVLSNVSS